MLLTRTALYAIAGALPFVSGRSIFDGEQAVMSETPYDIASPFTITLEAEASVSRRAEFAVVDVLVTGWGGTEWAAHDEGLAFANEIENRLTGFSKITTQVESWNRSEMHWRTRNHDHTYGPDSSLECEDCPKPLKVTTLFSIRFQEVDNFWDFVRMLTSNDGASAEYVKWEISEQTREDLGAELRWKAINKILAAGEDYARSFGKTVAEPLSFESLYTYETVSEDRHEWYMNDINLDPQNIELRTGVKCTFAVT